MTPAKRRAQQVRQTVERAVFLRRLERDMQAADAEGTKPPTTEEIHQKSGGPERG